MKKVHSKLFRNLDFFKNFLKIRVAPRIPYRYKLLTRNILCANTFSTKIQEKIIVVMGEPVISMLEWQKKKSIELTNRKQNCKIFSELENNSFNGEVPESSEGVRFEVSVIASIYRSGDLLDLFLGNLCEQTIFSRTEVILVVVDADREEKNLIVKFSQRFSNVKLTFVRERITIYAAWNLAINMSSAPYITNMNIDDLRSHNSLEVQIEFMRSHPWVDVGYQDYFYLLDRDLDWISIVNIGAISQSPPVTLSELSWFGLNPPHNGPIWKRNLHERLGLFDENLKSAGDYEFWMRAVSQGSVFAKMRDSTVGYFLNPAGMSTSLESPSKFEERELQQRYRTKIKLKSEIIDEIGLPEDFSTHPWDGAEVLTLEVLNRLKEV